MEKGLTMGRFLAKIRSRKKMSQGDVAVKMKRKTTGHLSRVENDKIGITLKQVPKFVVGYGLSRMEEALLKRFIIRNRVSKSIDGRSIPVDGILYHLSRLLPDQLVLVMETVSLWALSQKTSGNQSALG